MNYKLSRAALWSACCILAACGGGGGGSDAPAGGGATPPTPTVPSVVSTGDMFPSANDNRWVIRTDYPQASTFLRRVSSATTADGAELITISNDGGANPSVTETYRKTADAVWSVNDKSTDALSRAMGTYQMLRQPLKTGETFNSINRSGVASTVDFDLDGKPETIDAKIDVAVEAKETLQTPFGAVEAWRVRTFGTMKFYLSGNGKTLPVNISMLDWYAPGIGMVKRRSEVTVEGVKPTIFSEDLEAYKTSISSSPAVAPKVTQVRAEVNGAYGLRISFDRQVLIDEVCSGNSPVKYSTPSFKSLLPSFPARSVDLGQSGALDTVRLDVRIDYPGLYSLEMPACIVDRLGVRVDPTVIEFKAGESNAPLLVKTNLDVDTPLVSTPFDFELVFDKSIDSSASELNLTFKGFRSGSIISTEQVKGKIEGSKVKFSLGNSVFYDATYIATIKGALKATTGESSTYDFFMDTRSIDRPFKKPPKQYVGADLLVDVNKDGLPDRIFADISPGAVKIELASIDRTFQEARAIKIKNAPGHFDLEALLGAYDFNGDGKPDFVAKSFTLFSDGDEYGLVRHPELISNYRSYNMRFFVDYDGDSIPDLIEFDPAPGFDQYGGYYAGSFIVNKGKKDAKAIFLENHKVLRIAAASAPESISFSGSNIQVRDVNGDGMPDFYADGTLYLSTSEGNYRYFNKFMPVGFFDFDGDGRDELVVALEAENYYYIKFTSHFSWSTPVQITNSCGLRFGRNRFLRGDFNRDGAIDFALDCNLDGMIVGMKRAGLDEGYVFRDDIIYNFGPRESCFVVDADVDGYPDINCRGVIHWNNFKLPEYRSFNVAASNFNTSRVKALGAYPFGEIGRVVRRIASPRFAK